MRSHKQNQASRANGAKSKGPVTAEGKANSAANGNTHNLAGVGNLRLLSNECEIEFYNHQVGFIHRFQPIDIVEYDLVQKMITASWRLRRIEAMECALLEIEMERQKDEVAEEFEAIDEYGRQVLTLFGTTDATAAFNLLLRYAAAARRAYQSAYKILKDLQGKRFNQPNSDSPAFLPREPKTAPNTEASPTPTTASETTATAPRASATGNTPKAAAHTLIRRRHAMGATLPVPQAAKQQTEPKKAVAGRSFDHLFAA